MTFRSLCFVFACAVFSSSVVGQTAIPASSKSGVDLQAIDKSADPCNNFFQYACGDWMKNHPIPADESRYGRFNELQDRNLAILRGILEDSAQQQNRSVIDQKIGGFYQSCMNEPLIEQKGKAPLLPELQRISDITNRQQMEDEVARLQQMQVPVFFNFGSSPDLNDARMVIGDLDQGGLGLPERDYYFRTDPKSQEIRQKYVKHLEKLYELIGVSESDAQKKAATVMVIETALAKASLDVTSRRDPQTLNHKMSRSELAQLSPHFDFNRFFVQLQTPQFDSLNVDVPAFMKALSDVVGNTRLDDLKDYLRVHCISSSARLLPKTFVTENFDFYSRTLAGVKELKPRWKRCVAATDDELGDALGRKFVEKTFGEQGKQRTMAMVHEIEKQMGNDINSISWMTPETKKQAQVKLQAVAGKIGYPEKWKDYATVQINGDDYFGNWYRANEYESKRQRDKIGKPVDRTEWAMSAPTVNAYYDPTQNNINFPAGILQPPFYSNQFDNAVNYGAIGVVIGHELTHGFDDEGRQFDADGNLKDWWQKSDEEQFTKLADCIVKEYGAFSPVPGVKVNGKLTLGENTADNGGIRLAYMALLDDLARKSMPLTDKVDGYTQAQEFFLGFGQVWCENERPESARMSVQTDPHSPPEFRVNGVVSNMQQFSEAFGCKEGDKMYSANACRVW